LSRLDFLTPNEQKEGWKGKIIEELYKGRRKKKPEKKGESKL